MNTTSTNEFPAAGSTDPATSSATFGGPDPTPHQTGWSARMKAKFAASVLAVGLLTGGGIALSQMGDSGAATAATAGSQTAAGGAGAPAAAGNSGAPAGGGAPMNGTITAVSATSISVKSSTGTVTTYKIATETVVENDGTTSTAGDLTVGEEVVVFTGSAPGAATTTTASSDTASRIMAGSSATQGPGAGAAGNAPAAGDAPAAGAAQPTAAATT
jgi:hypothetical protein